MDGTSTTLEAVDILELMELLPHRYPFLMVDKIIDIDGRNSAVGIKNVTYNEPHFMGHFPRQPVMPGVLMLEGMAQTAGAITMRDMLRSKEVGPSEVVYLMSIDGAKFRKPVVPGDVVEYHVRKAHGRGRVYRFTCKAKVGGVVVAEATVTAMTVDK